MFLNKKSWQFWTEKKRTYWMNTFSCILHMLRKVTTIFRQSRKRCDRSWRKPWAIRIEIHPAHTEINFVPFDRHYWIKAQTALKIIFFFKFFSWGNNCTSKIPRQFHVYVIRDGNMTDHIAMMRKMTRPVTSPKKCSKTKQ